MKPVWTSLTLWSAVVALVGAVLAFFASGQSAVGVVSDPGVQDAIGKVLTVLGFVGTVAGRLRVGDLHGPIIETKEPPDQRGTIAAGLALLLAGAVVVVGLGAFLWGCASTDIRAEKSVHPFFDPGPPCVLTVDVDDVRAYRVRWDEECPLDMPTPWLCARLAEKAPGAKLPAVCTP